MALPANRPLEELLAIRIRHDQQLGRGHIDPFAVARRLGLEVVLYPVEDGGVEGQYRPLADGGGAIFVNSSTGVVRQRFTAAHEIGHALLHRDQVIIDDAIETPARTLRERQADRFAGALLVDPSAAADVLSSQPDLDRAIATLVDRFDVSVPTAAIALQQFDLVSGDAISDFFARYKEIGHRDFMRAHGFRSRHREGSGEQVRDETFDRRVESLLAAGQLTPETAADLLETTVEKLPEEALRARDRLATSAGADPDFD